MENIINYNIADNRFWTQIMGDHARFVLNALSPQESSEVAKVQNYIMVFDKLLAQFLKPLSGDQITTLNQQVFQNTQDFRKFMLHLIRRQISEKIILSLRPSFLNHIVNDTEQFLDSLALYLQNKMPELTPAGVSLVWILNIYVNALTIADALDATIFDHNKRIASDFANTFLNLYFKAYVMNGLRRSGINDFPALTALNDDVENEMLNFAEYIISLLKLMEDKKVLGNLTVLYLDNMYRQLCFYMTKLSSATKVKLPSCDPASPRKE